MALFSSKSRWVAAAFAAMGIGVAFHAAHALLGFGGHGLDSFTNNWLYTAVELIAVAVCAARVFTKRENRWAWALVTFGLLTWTGGDLLWTVWLGNLTNPPFPSVADGLYLLPPDKRPVLKRPRWDGAAESGFEWLPGGVGLGGVFQRVRMASVSRS